MSKNKTIFGHVHVHANNACKYDANGNIFFTYRIPDAGCQDGLHRKLDTLFFVLLEDAFLTLPPTMLVSFLLLCVVGPLSGVYGLPWNLPPNFRCTYMSKNITCRMIFYWYVWKFIHIFKNVSNNNVSFIFLDFMYIFVGFITQIWFTLPITVTVDSLIFVKVQFSWISFIPLTHELISWKNYEILYIFLFIPNT